MKGYTHLVCGLLISITLYNLGLINPEQTMYIIFGCMLPDAIDYGLSIKHRSKITHNLLTSLLIMYLSYIYGLVNIFFIGFGIFHHLLLDSTTKMGIYIGNRKLKGNLKTNNDMHNFLIICIHLLLLLFLQQSTI